jgi:hypothetical protein
MGWNGGGGWWMARFVVHLVVRASGEWSASLVGMVIVT